MSLLFIHMCMYVSLLFQSVYVCVRACMYYVCQCVGAYYGHGNEKGYIKAFEKEEDKLNKNLLSFLLLRTGKCD